MFIAKHFAEKAFQCVGCSQIYLAEHLEFEGWFHIKKQL